VTHHGKSFLLISIVTVILGFGCKSPKTSESDSSGAARKAADISEKTKIFGLVADARHNLLSVELKTSAGITVSEKRDLGAIITKAKETMAAFRSGTIPPQDAAAIFFTSTAGNKLSLYYQFMEIAENYPDIVRPNDAQLLSRNPLFDERKDEQVNPKNDVRNTSDCGIELMYFASAAYAIGHSAIQLAMAPATSPELGNYGRKMIELYAKPLLKTYSQDIETKNRWTIERGITDYNLQFYSDAVTATWMYDSLNKLR
jgi:hypothetical protein